METTVWRRRLHAILPASPSPLFVIDGLVTPAASIWSGMRLWTQAFRDAGMALGDRLLLALAPSAEFVQVLLAAFWEGLTVAVAPPTAVEDARSSLDARIVVAADSGRKAVWTADGPCGPAALRPEPPASRTPPTPDARLLLKTSGTTTQARWIALSDTNLFAVLDSHLPLLDLAGARVLSVLPWHHAFGLVLDLLAAIFSRAEIIRESAAVQDPEAALAVLAEGKVTHLCAVPYFVRRLADRPGGAEALRELRGGIIGGARAAPALCERLANTRLRVGYGLTEASPGVCLGLPGVWRPLAIGAPVGCAIKIDRDGRLCFQGPNAHLGIWTQDGLERLPADRWVATGDIVRRDAGDLLCVGRADDAIKLDNGRFLACAPIEESLRRRYAGIDEVLLVSRDGSHLEILWSSEQEGLDRRALDAAVQTVLGPLATRLSAVRRVPAHAWKRTGKGELDRNANSGAWE